MRTHLVGGLVLLATLAPVASAQNATDLRVAVRADAAVAAPRGASGRIHASSKLWVEGNSTVRRYRCEAGAINGNVATSDAALASFGDLQKVVRGVDLTIPVQQLECGDRTMDGHMRKALKAEEHPAIRFRLTSHEVVEQGPGKGTVKLTSKLSIAGKENTITMTADAVQEPSGMVRVRGSKELKMTDFGVKPPSLMLGTMKVHDPVTVSFDMLLQL